MGLTYLLLALAFLFVGPYVILYGHSGAYISAGLISAGFCLGYPSYSAFISDRVERDHQSKIASAVSMFGCIGAAIGIPLYNRVLFRATHTGMARATTVFASVILSLVCFGAAAESEDSESDVSGNG